jgi:preprotein translocase subunit SecY
MVQSKARNLLNKKIYKILFLLLLVRLGLYIPVPGIDLNIFTQGQTLNPMFGFAKSLVGNSFLGIGSIGILPYINASIIVQLLIPIFPSLEKLQKEEGEIGRRQINKYTRYLTFGWAIILSTIIAFVLIKPITFDWSVFKGIKIIISLTVGSILSMWFAELITEEGLGNGSSMLIFINIVGGIPSSLSDANDFFYNDGLLITNIVYILQGLLIYSFIVLFVILFQDSYKKVDIVSAKQLSLNTDLVNFDTKLRNTFIPLKLNQGGIMPLVFSSTVAVPLIYPIQIFLNSRVINIDTSSRINLLTFCSFGLNIILVVFFSCFYVSLVLKPTDMSENLSKMAYSIQGIRQGRETTKFLQKIINRLAFVGGLFLAFLTFLPILLASLFHLTMFKNLTSLLILIGVITDTTSQISGYLVSTRYETFKKI